MTGTTDYLFEDISISKDEDIQKRYNKDLDDKIRYKVISTIEGDVILISTRLGGGKTTLMIKHLVSLTPKSAKTFETKFIFLTGTLRQGFDAMKTFSRVMDDETLKNFDILELKGKAHYCIFDKYVEYSKHYGIGISTFCEICECKFGKGGLGRCEFWIRLEEIVKTPSSFRGAHGFLGNIVDYVLDKGKHTEVIIDENPKSTIFQKKSVSRKKIEDSMIFIKYLCPESDERKLLLDVLSIMLNLFNEIKNHDLMKKHWEKNIKSLDDRLSDNLDTTKGLGDFIDDIFTEIRDHLVDNSTVVEKIPKGLHYLNILGDITRKYHNEKKGTEFLSYSLQKKKFKDGKNYLILHYCNLDIINLKNVRTWILDATTHPLFYKSIFGDRLQVVDDSSVIKNKFLVIQSTESKLGMNKLVTYDQEKRTFIPTYEFDKYYEIVKKIIKKHINDKIFISSRKSRNIQNILLERLERDFKKKRIHAHKTAKTDFEKERKIIEISDISLDYYDAIRGLNDYLGYNVCILFGGAFPNPQEVKRHSIISGIDSEVITKTRREDEMNQTIGRIRPTEDSVVYIFSNIELGFTNQYNTYRMNIRDIHGFLDEGLLISDSVMDALKRNDKFIKDILNKMVDIDDYLHIPFFDEYERRLTGYIENLKRDVIKYVKSAENGIDHADIKRRFYNDPIDTVIDHLIRKENKLKEYYYKTSFISKKRKRRIFHGKYDLIDFDNFIVICENMKIDGKKRSNILNEIIYIIRYVLESASINEIVNSLEIKFKKKNKELIKNIVDELCTRGIILMKDNGYIYNVHNEKS